MTESNFLLVDLNKLKTKKLAETITSETSRKILNYLSEKEDTEQNITKILQIPISTVHYHLQKLQEVGLVAVHEFHYSQKGREVNHYKLANKYIIIAPQKVSGLREKLKGILPATLIVLVISGIIKLVQNYNHDAEQLAVAMKAVTPTLAQEVSRQTVQDKIATNASAVQDVVIEAISKPLQQPDIALWFLFGSTATILIYTVVEIVREKINKINNYIFQ